MRCDVRTVGKKPSIAKWYSDSKSNFNNNNGGSDGDDTGIDDDDDEHETVGSNDPTNERGEAAGKVVSASSSSSLSSNRSVKERLIREQWTVTSNRSRCVKIEVSINYNI
jgi:hypothetical protein